MHGMKQTQFKIFLQIWVRWKSVIQMWKVVHELFLRSRDVSSKESQRCLRGGAPACSTRWLLQAVLAQALDKGIPQPWLAHQERARCAKTSRSNANYGIPCSSSSSTVGAKKSSQNEVPVLTDNIKSHGQRWQRGTVQGNDGARHVNSYEQLLPFKNIKSAIPVLAYQRASWQKSRKEIFWLTVAHGADRVGGQG